MICVNMLVQCVGMNLASSGTALLVFSKVREDRSSRKNSEVYGIYIDFRIQSNAAKLIGQYFTVQMDDDPKHTAKATQVFLKVKREIFCNGKVKLLILTRSSMYFTC